MARASVPMQPRTLLVRQAHSLRTSSLPSHQVVIGATPGTRTLGRIVVTRGMFQAATRDLQPLTHMELSSITRCSRLIHSWFQTAHSRSIHFSRCGPCTRVCRRTEFVACRTTMPVAPRVIVSISRSSTTMAAAISSSAAILQTLEQRVKSAASTIRTLRPQ